MPGWHLHFLSDDKTKRGHVLGLTMTNGNGGLVKITDFEMILPSTDSFGNMNLTENMANKIKSVE